MDNQLQLALPTTDETAGFIKSIEVRRSARRRRTVAAKVEEDTLIVYLPLRMSKAEEAQWIEKMRRRLEDRERRDRLNSSGDLEVRAHELNERYFDGKLEWSSIEYVTNQKTRYGSCTITDATIRLSDSLADMPVWVRDYVIVHELAHLIVPDHSSKFWDVVCRYPMSERARGFLIARGMEEA